MSLEAAKKAYEQGHLALYEYKEYLQKELLEIQTEYDKIKPMKTYYCVSYKKYYNGDIECVRVSDLKNSIESPENSIEEYNNYALYNEWYDDSQYAYLYLNKLKGNS